MAHTFDLFGIIDLKTSLCSGSVFASLKIGSKRKNTSSISEEFSFGPHKRMHSITFGEPEIK